MIKRFLERIRNDGQPASVERYSDLLEPGSIAPDFTLPAIASSGEAPTSRDTSEVSLSDLRGRPAVLVFYPADNSNVCTSQLALYNEALNMVTIHQAQIVAISVDDLDSHRTFSNRLNLSFPLLSDNDPAGAMARNYGAFDEVDGVCERALYVLDAGGRVQWRTVFPRKVNPGMDGILRALESLAAYEHSG
jgi:peroxiredoxin